MKTRFLPFLEPLEGKALQSTLAPTSAASVHVAKSVPSGKFLKGEITGSYALSLEKIGTYLVSTRLSGSGRLSPVGPFRGFALFPTNSYLALSGNKRYLRIDLDTRGKEIVEDRSEGGFPKYVARPQQSLPLRYEIGLGVGIRQRLSKVGTVLLTLTPDLSAGAEEGSGTFRLVFAGRKR